MEFYDVLRTRRSIRKYKKTPVEQDKIERMLEAVRLAPSAKNIQPWHFLVIKDESVKRALGEAYPQEWFAEAPVLICACGEPAKAWVRRDGKSYLDVDVAIAFEHLILAAAAEGLGTCWIGAFDPVKVKRALGLPDGVEPIAMTPLGYAAEEPRPFERRTIADFVRLEKW